jgi:7-cyano-7-deazaguanine synthase
VKCVVILSGGPDSVTTLYWARAQGWDAHALTFRYGQKAQVEVERASEFAERLSVPHRVIDLSALSEVYEGVTSLVDEDLTVSGEFTKPIIVPFRNGVFMSVAVAYADAVGAERILYGAHGGDESNYPDCRPEFYKAFEKAARLGTERSIVIDAPFSGGSKAEIIRKAVELGVPLERTWSCYERGPVHCGRCESCRNRKRAFAEAKIEDPTQYAE